VQRPFQIGQAPNVANDARIKLATRLQFFGRQPYRNNNRPDHELTEHQRHRTPCCVTLSALPNRNDALVSTEAVPPANVDAGESIFATPPSATAAPRQRPSPRMLRTRCQKADRPDGRHSQRAKTARQAKGVKGGYCKTDNIKANLIFRFPQLKVNSGFRYNQKDRMPRSRASKRTGFLDAYNPAGTHLQKPERKRGIPGMLVSGLLSSEIYG
jgi:hypothetical protein